MAGAAVKHLPLKTKGFQQNGKSPGKLYIFFLTSRRPGLFLTDFWYPSLDFSYYLLAKTPEPKSPGVCFCVLQATTLVSQP